MKFIALFLLTLALLPAHAVTIPQLLSGAAPQTRIYKKTGDLELRFFFFQPADLAPGERRPAVVWIHGGGWTGGTLDGFMPHARYVASRGAIGFNLEYRLLKPEGPLIGDCIADCKSALRYIRAHAAELGVDPHRIAVAGDSAGGHLAAALGTLDGFDDPADELGVSARPDAMLLFNPVLDLTEGDWIRSAVAGRALANKKSPRHATPEAIAQARALSPVFHVRPGQPPALLMHGLADTVVPATQAERLATEARSAGNRCDLILLPDTPHAFVVAFWKSPEPVVVETLRAADRFLASLGYCRGEPTLELSPQPAWIPRPAN